MESFVWYRESREKVMKIGSLENASIYFLMASLWLASYHEVDKSIDHSRTCTAAQE